jgi:CsoR family transcriptional regulator, copper-sensing transcriptional repressor
MPDQPSHHSPSRSRSKKAQPAQASRGAPPCCDGDDAAPVAGAAGKAATTDTARLVGPGAHAAGVDTQIKQANLKHLRRIEGQVRGIAAMIEDDRYCADIITQVAAVRESLHSVARNLMANHVRHCAARAMGTQGDTRDEMITELLDLVSKLSR